MEAVAVCHKNYSRIPVKATIMFQEWSYAHLPNFNNVCALSNLVSSLIKFNVWSKHAFTSCFSIFARNSQQTKNTFAAACCTEITVWCRWMLWFCLVTWSWEAFSGSLYGICSVSLRGVGKHNNPSSGVARAFPGGRATHPEDQIEEEKLRKNETKCRRMRKCPFLAHPGLRIWLPLWVQVSHP